MRNDSVERNDDQRPNLQDAEERGVYAASLFVRPTGIEHQTVGRVEAV
jgi:hypothetical protein